MIIYIGYCFKESVLCIKTFARKKLKLLKVKILSNKWVLLFRFHFTELALNYNCIHDLHEEYVDCEGPADWFEKSDQSAICQLVWNFFFIDHNKVSFRIYQDILNCQYVKTAELCGLQAAQTLRCFSKDVLNGSMVTTCKTNDPPDVKSPMPVMQSLTVGTA